MSNVSGADQEAARRLREEVVAAGGHLTVATPTLLVLFAVHEPTPDERTRVAGALSSEGLECWPRIEKARADGEIRVALKQRRRDDRDGDDSDAAEPNQPVLPAAGRVVADQAAALSTGAIAAGVLVPGVLATLIGFGAWWGYGLLFLALTALGWWLILRTRVWLAKIFWLPLRPVALSAFMLGALPLLLGVAVASAVVVAPIAAKRDSDARERQARALIADADTALDRGDLDRADRLLRRAQERSRDADGYEQAKARADQNRRERDAERERSARYANAKKMFADGDYAEAVAALDELGGYRDSAPLADEYATRGAQALVAEGRSALRRGDRQFALRRASAAIDLRPTQTARALRSDAKREIRAAEARARAREVARRQAAEQRAVERRAARRARAEARRQARQQAAQPAVPDDLAPDYGTEPNGNWCGATRDGDGDGIWCEGR